MKRIFFISLLFISILVACNTAPKENEYVKKVALNEETIAVGIYKATGYEFPNVKYVAEAINIDAGIVYVTLTDADVLKTKLENIDVLIFPGMKNGQNVEMMDDEIVGIIKNFITQKGKGAIGICNGNKILSNSENYQSLGLVNVDMVKVEEMDFNAGLINFQITESGKDIFPDLNDYQDLYIDFVKEYKISLLDTTSQIEVLAEFKNLDTASPFIITAKAGKGKVAMLNANPEITPGMRWIIPRMVRWSINKDYVWYEKNIFRPDLFSSQLNIDDEINAKLDDLLLKLDNGNKEEIIDAMDELQSIYPWVATEKVRSLLIEKNDDIKIRAAKYLVDNEYTAALEDFRNSLKTVRSRKVKEQLLAYQTELERMKDQN